MPDGGGLIETIPVGVWLPPQDLLALTNRVGEALHQTCEIRSQRGKSFREAYMASRFALFRGAEAVRLLPETGQHTPDFAIRLHGQELIYENTEADNPLLHRNEAYETTCRQFGIGEAHPTTTPVMISPDAYATEIARLVAKKVAKHYQRCQGLLIRSNTTWIEGLEDPPLDWWRAACAGAKARFEECWVFHHRHFFAVYEGAD